MSALAEPIGAPIGLTGVELNPSLHAAFLAFAAGATICVSVSELYPMGRRLGHLGEVAIGDATAVPTDAILQLATSTEPPSTTSTRAPEVPRCGCAALSLGWT